MFETIEGKKNNNWYLWIFHSAETVVYKIHPTRSSQALIEYFGKEHDGGTLNVDRYSAYKVIAKNGLFILAFCWAHVRRDFLDHAKGYVKQELWALARVERIGKIYHINNERIQHKPQSKLFHEKDVELKQAISEMKKELAAALFTLFKTLKLWKINVHTWMLAYFYECALIGGMPPENINKFLPWEMSEEKRQLFSKPPEYKNSG